MATLPSEIRPQPVPPSKLWFGLATSAAAWVALCFTDLMIVGQVCGYASEYGVTRTHEVARWFLFGIAVVLFLIAVTSGVTSYRNWRAISQHDDMLTANAADRREFMGVLGVIITITLGAGIVWLALPPLIVEFCVRAK